MERTAALRNVGHITSKMNYTNEKNVICKQNFTYTAKFQ